MKVQSTEEHLNLARVALNKLLTASSPYWLWQSRTMSDAERHEMEVARIYALNAVEGVKWP